MIYWLDDDTQILELIKTIFTNVEIVTLTHWSLIPELKEGDTVFHDHDGVGEKPVEINGVNYFCCSGTTNENVKVDFRKPFNVKEITEVFKQVA